MIVAGSGGRRDDDFVDSYDDSYGAGSDTGGYLEDAPPPRRRRARRQRRCHRGGRGLLGFGFGVSQGQGENAVGSTGLNLGYRAGPVGLLAEMQFAEGEVQARVESIESQARLYLGLDDCVDLFPLVGVGRYESFFGETSGTVSYGIGLELHLGRVLSLGARFSRSELFTPLESAGLEGGELRHRDLFLFQTSLYF